MILIDPGHATPTESGMDHGVIANGLREADIALEISKLVAAGVRAHGFSVGLTRTDNSGLAVARRKQLIAADHVELVTSVHLNGAASEAAEGHETFVSAFNGESQRLGKSIAAQLLMGAAIKPRKPPIKTKLSSVTGRDYYYIIDTPTRAGIPSVLVEVGFLTSKKDAAILGSFWGQFSTAYLIAQGVLDYLNVV